MNLNLYLDERPVQQIVDANLVPRMIEFLQMEDEPKLQVRLLRKKEEILIYNMKVDAACVLGAVALGTEAQSQTVLDEGAIPWLAKSLSSKNKDLRVQV